LCLMTTQQANNQTGDNNSRLKRKQYKTMDNLFGVGDAIPSTLTLDLGFPPTKVNVLEHTKGKKVILMGLPGAYTPT